MIDPRARAKQAGDTQPGPPGPGGRHLGRVGELRACALAPRGHVKSSGLGTAGLLDMGLYAHVFRFSESLQSQSYVD
jgi:hypothetical protein